MLGAVSFQSNRRFWSFETHSVSRASRKVVRSCSSMVELMMRWKEMSRRRRGEERKSRKAVASSSPFTAGGYNASLCDRVDLPRI